MTGLSLQAFAALLPGFTTAYSLNQPERKRKRVMGDGRKHKRRRIANLVGNELNVHMLTPESSDITL
jgi:hypothetical protein